MDSRRNIHTFDKHEALGTLRQPQSAYQTYRPQDTRNFRLPHRLSERRIRHLDTAATQQETQHHQSLHLPSSSYSPLNGPKSTPLPRQLPFHLPSPESQTFQENKNKNKKFSHIRMLARRILPAFLALYIGFCGIVVLVLGYHRRALNRVDLVSFYANPLLLYHINRA